jgi:hypothetical protein
MTIPKHLKSNVIAAICTVLIHLLLIGTLSLKFSDESSSKLNDADEDILLQLEQMAAEEIQMTPQGKDPLSNKTDKASESISKSKGSIKPPSTSAPETEQRDMSEIVTPPDTIIKKIEVVQTIKVDTAQQVQQLQQIQDSAIAEILKKTEISIKKDASKPRMSPRERAAFYQKNARSIRNFMKVYPYALKTREIIENLNKQLATMKDESAKKKLIKDTEKMLFSQYESAVRTMTTPQGRLLLKLIARETNKTGYDIIKEYKGAFSATFWYGVGKIFGTDLKSEYHKENEDSLIENILDKYNRKDL